MNVCVFISIRLLSKVDYEFARLMLSSVDGVVHLSKHDFIINNRQRNAGQSKAIKTAVSIYDTQYGCSQFNSEPFDLVRLHKLPRGCL